MKAFAHRGWSAGVGENTLASFHKAHQAGVGGVEFDVRLGADGKTVVLSHDKVTVGDVLTLDEALQFFASTKLELLLEFKEYSYDFFNEVVRLLGVHHLLDRVTIFGFPEIAKQFPWGTRREVKLGIIAPYPHNLKNYIVIYSPDMILFGWGNTVERALFKIFWSFRSLSNIFVTYPHIKFVIGVTYSNKDKEWLARKEGLYGITLDMPLL